MRSLQSIREAFWGSGRPSLRKDAPDIGCGKAQHLMSAFIDSMTTADEVEALETHLAACTSCRRQLRAYVSLRNLLAGVEEPPLPEGLALETRVRLSRQRNSDPLARAWAHYHNAVTPAALPAMAGLCLTVLGFMFLFSNVAVPAVRAANNLADMPILYERVRTPNPTLTRLAGNSLNLSEPLTIETYVDGRGRVMSYVILAGPDNPEIRRQLQEFLLLAEFTPARHFGRPVESRLILSFVGVS